MQRFDLKYENKQNRTSFLLYFYIYNIQWTILINWIQVFSSPEPKARVSYCHSAPSVVRPSVVVVVVVRPSGVNFSHFRLLLQNCLMDFDETWYAWSTHGPLQVLLFFGQIRPRGGSRWRGKNRSQGVPFFKKLLLQTGRLLRQTKYIAMT